MPELPEVEVLVQYLDRALKGRQIKRVAVHRDKSVLPQTSAEFSRRLTGAKISGVRRRAKSILFDLKSPDDGKPFLLVGHLGMTGRMFVQADCEPAPKHTIVIFDLDQGQFVFEDARRFGKLNLDATPLAKLGPEPLDASFNATVLKERLGTSRQPIKVKLLDQETLAGIGNIYASEALWLAGISPRKPAGELTEDEIAKLRSAISTVLQKAVDFGKAAALRFEKTKEVSDGLFYYGSGDGGADAWENPERFNVYDRADQPCPKCGTPIERLVQAARSTYYCPHCQEAVAESPRRRRH